MQRSTRLAVLTLAALGAAWSSQALAGTLALQSGSKLWLEGKSTIHEYQSKASVMSATIQEKAALWPASATGAAAIEKLVRAKGVTSMKVVVGVTGLHSGKTGLDKNMYKALSAPKYPEICFTMTGYEVAEGKKASEIAIDAKGTLSVAGVERQIHLPITAVREGETLRLRGSTPLLMTQYGVKPPVMMMGTLRVADQVTVSFDLLLGTGAASASKAE